MKVTVNNLEKDETIDWDKVQLVVSLNGKVIHVLKNQSDSDDDEFTGVELLGF